MHQEELILVWCTVSSYIPFGSQNHFSCLYKRQRKLLIISFIRLDCQIRFLQQWKILSILIWAHKAWFKIIWFDLNQDILILVFKLASIFFYVFILSMIFVFALICSNFESDSQADHSSSVLQLCALKCMLVYASEYIS